MASISATKSILFLMLSKKQRSEALVKQLISPFHSFFHKQILEIPSHLRRLLSSEKKH